MKTPQYFDDVADKLDEATQRGLIDGVYPSGEWSRFPNYLLTHFKLSDGEAILYAYLLGQHFHFADHSLLTDGWFWKTGKQIEKSLGYNDQKQWRLLCRLKKLKLIKFKRTKEPKSKRRIKIDLRQLAGRIHDYHFTHLKNEGTLSNLKNEGTHLNREKNRKSPPFGGRILRNPDPVTVLEDTPMKDFGLCPKVVKTTPPTEEDKKNAQRLVNGVAKHCKFKNHYSAASWAREFAKLRTVNEVEPQRIRRALDWYLQHIGEPYIPVACSASGFRKKFTAIEAAMRRSLGDTPTKAYPPIDRTYRIGVLEEMNWPSKVRRSQLKDALTKTYLNFCRLFDGMAKIHDHEDFKGPIRELVQEKLLSPSSATYHWLLAYCDEVQSWDSWSGSLKAGIFDFTNSRTLDWFYNYFREWSENDPEGRARRFMDEINHATA